jgi:hypothetical protein
MKNVFFSNGRIGREPHNASHPREWKKTNQFSFPVCFCVFPPSRFVFLLNILLLSKCGENVSCGRSKRALRDCRGAWRRVRFLPVTLFYLSCVNFLPCFPSCFRFIFSQWISEERSFSSLRHFGFCAPHWQTLPSVSQSFHIWTLGSPSLL